MFGFCSVIFRFLLFYDIVLVGHSMIQIKLVLSSSRRPGIFFLISQSVSDEQVRAEQQKLLSQVRIDVWHYVIIEPSNENYQRLQVAS